jgi:flavorubredoxin
MNRRPVANGIEWLGAVDWNRRLFDGLMPLPDGTSYNAWLIRGSDKVALLDTADPSTGHILLEQLADVPQVDYVISHHAEQDHSGMIPTVLAKYPDAKLVASPRCLTMLSDLMEILQDRLLPVKDNDTLDLGGRTLKFMHMPWVHWPETMVTWLEEDKILFTGDLFGSHLATSSLFADESVYEPAKRYYAEIMMPYRTLIAKHLDKIVPLAPEMICTTHGPAYKNPGFILDAYKEWVSAEPKNKVLVPYVSMHGSTQILVDRLVAGLADRGIEVQPFDLTVTDLDKLSIQLVDAATVVFASPVFLNGPHPMLIPTAYIANALKPKLKYVGFMQSYSWGGKIMDSLTSLMPNLKVEVLTPVSVKGLPKADDLAAVDALVDEIAQRHESL